MKRSHGTVLGALTLLLVPLPAMAAPFCVKVTGVPAQCLYVDPAQCQREAQRAGGRCDTNPREYTAPVSALGYCLAQAGNALSCVYPAYADCENDARRLGGSCVAAAKPKGPRPAAEPGKDPFELTRP